MTTSNQNESTTITKTEPARSPGVVGAEMAIAQIVARKEKVLEILHTVMDEGRHYGLIPGCGDKPALFKAGAELLALTFGLAPTFTIEQANLEGGHREYRITCSLRHIASGVVLGEGVGSCSTQEKKYRIKYGKPNPDLADVYNTVLKMAKKRAQVDATLTVVGASDLLTQDIEEIPREDRRAPEGHHDDAIEADFHDQRDEGKRVTTTAFDDQRALNAQRDRDRAAPPNTGPVPPNLRVAMESATTPEQLRELHKFLGRLNTEDRARATADYDRLMANLTRKAS
jgi:hypothetical protein